MIKVLILGSSGLIGHTLIRELSGSVDVYGTLHRSMDTYKPHVFNTNKIIEKIDVLDFARLEDVISIIKPDWILNCTGITKRKITEKNILETIGVNSYFPQVLAKLATKYNFRVIQFSTDCVFNGKRGNYTETDLTTAEDLYGRTKALGEIITNKNCLTLRSSFIGLELFNKTELLEWFLSMDGKIVTGFRKTLYSGVTTVFMSCVIKDIIHKHSNISGLFHLATINPISKYDLLHIAREKFKLDIQINPDDNNIHTPTLNATKLREETGIIVPDWNEMMEKLAEYKDVYE